MKIEYKKRGKPMSSEDDFFTEEKKQPAFKWLKEKRSHTKCVCGSSEFILHPRLAEYMSQPIFSLVCEECGAPKMFEELEVPGNEFCRAKKTKAHPSKAEEGVLAGSRPNPSVS
jgi:hypothetical protein